MHATILLLTTTLLRAQTPAPQPRFALEITEDATPPFYAIIQDGDSRHFLQQESSSPPRPRCRRSQALRSQTHFHDRRRRGRTHRHSGVRRNRQGRHHLPPCKTIRIRNWAPPPRDRRAIARASDCPGSSDEARPRTHRQHSGRLFPGRFFQTISHPLRPFQTLRPTRSRDCPTNPTTFPQALPRCIGFRKLIHLRHPSQPKVRRSSSPPQFLQAIRPQQSTRPIRLVDHPTIPQLTRSARK